MLTSSRQLQNRSFYVVERTRTALKCTKMKIARAKHAKRLFFIVICANFVTFLLPPWSCLLKLPVVFTYSEQKSPLYGALYVS